MLQATATRVQQHTCPYVNNRIRKQIHDRVSALETNPSHEAIAQRLDEIDREWDIERALQTNFAIFSMVGLTLATTVSRRWFALALGVPAFMVQHALQGWCPPLPVMRRLGFRTAREINEERFALKALRGDFREAARSGDAEAILQAVRS